MKLKKILYISHARYRNADLQIYDHFQIIFLLNNNNNGVQIEFN